MPENSKESIFVIISDNQANYLLERVLRSAGYSVTSTKDKATSEKLMETNQPSLVILGDKLTDGNGLELARNLIRRFPALPVLLFVNSDSTRPAQRSSPVGCDGLPLPAVTH